MTAVPRRTGRPGLRRAVAQVLAAALLYPAVVFGEGLGGIPICHGFGCSNQGYVTINELEWSQIKGFFRKPAATPEQEREQIRRAAGWFEVVVGRHSPIHQDKGKNEYPGRTMRARLDKDENDTGTAPLGQMDCIDESLNMTTYLTIMESAGLFRHHKVVDRALRQSAVDQHYAGQIEENETGERWVVDSWFYDYGSLPYVEKSEEWLDIPFLFSTSFPEAADE